MAGLPPRHKTTEDAVLHGMRVPKKTQIVYSLYAAQRDPQIDTAQDLDKFKPQRFLDKENVFKRDGNVSFWFGLGKRRCPGELLARAEV
jgi:cytochrome P450